MLSNPDLEKELYRYGAILGIVLGCGGVSKSQVQKLLEVAGANPEYAYEMILSYVLYQQGRAREQREREKQKEYIPPVIANNILFVFLTLANIKKGKLSQEEVLKVLGIAKWIYQAIITNTRACRAYGPNAVSVQGLAKTYPDFESVLKSIAMAFGLRL